MDAKDQSGRVTVLDVVAVVMGSAIASLHVLRVMRSGLSVAGWAMVGLTFALAGRHRLGAIPLRRPSRHPSAARLSRRRRPTLGACWEFRGC